MSEFRIGAVEKRFAEIIWRSEPVPSGELVKICESELGWKKSTTYTMLRRLCQRGIFQNSNGVVTSLLSEADFQTLRGEEFLNESFGGSLPKFIASFAERNKLSDREIEELQELIGQMGGR